MPIPVLAAIGAGSALHGALRGTRSSRPGREEREYADLYRGAVGGLGDRARGLTSRYEQDMEAFDPEPLYAQATEARLEGFDDDFARTYASGLGRMVGQGRTPSYSGFGLRDAQETIRQGQQERGRIRQQGADNLAQARMNMLGMRGQYASGVDNRYMDAITGRYNSLEAQRMENDASRRGMAGSLLGAAANGLGAYYGGRGR